MPRKRPSREARMRKKRRWLLEIQGYRCFYCSCFLDFADATVDHLLPQSLGGGDHIDNLAAACGLCNSRRGNRSVREMLKLTQPLATLPQQSKKLNPWKKVRRVLGEIIFQFIGWTRTHSCLPKMRVRQDVAKAKKE